MTVREAIRTILGGSSLDGETARKVAEALIGGQATAAQIGALLTALRMKGETVEEILGFVRAMRDQMTAVPVEGDDVIDTCGTGGDGAGTFNISTVAAFVAAGAGCRVAKHGNRAVSSRCGSADLLDVLGVPCDLSAAAASRMLSEVGLCFLFAPRFHPSLKHCASARKEIGVRTILNTVGPLANPARTKRQLIGVFDPQLTEPLAEALLRLGSTHCLVVHGEDGLDEITLTGPTRVTEARDGTTSSYTIHPEQFGLSPVRPNDLRGGDVETNADTALSVLHGEPGPARDVVMLNAGAAIYVARLADSIQAGVRLAAEAIDSGRALAKLEQLRGTPIGAMG